MSNENNDLINHITDEIASIDEDIAQYRKDIAKAVEHHVHHPLDTARVEELVQYLRSADGKRAALVDILRVVKRA